MERRVLWMALLLAAAMGLGCGDDSGGDDDSEGEAGRSGSSARGGSGAGGGGQIEGEGEPCGTVRCTMPENATGEPCCYDVFSSTCGMRGGFDGMACVSIVEEDPRCPSVTIGGMFTLVSCCTDDNQCGIMSAFGSQGCTDLATAEMNARERAMMFMNDEDGGMSTFDGGFMVPDGGFMIDFPDPQACE